MYSTIISIKISNFDESFFDTASQMLTLAEHKSQNERSAAGGPWGRSAQFIKFSGPNDNFEINENRLKTNKFDF